MNGWCSIIPDKMYQSFVERGFFKNGDSSFMDHKYHSSWYKILLNKWQRKYVEVNKNDFSVMDKEVRTWYAGVFKYVTDWLKKNDFISLKKGSFDGGFCAESDPNADTVKRCGAPLVYKKNKVAQIKEKFGEIRVYFDYISKEERKKVYKFSKQVEKKFDCITVFC